MAFYSDNAAGNPAASLSGPSSPTEIIDVESGAAWPLPPAADAKILNSAVAFPSHGAAETSPLLSRAASPRGSACKRKFGWLGAPAPAWVAALAVVASLSRSMVLAPRVQVLTQLACQHLHPVPAHHSVLHLGGPPLVVFDALPDAYTSAPILTTILRFAEPSLLLREMPDSTKCGSDDAVQAAAVRIQTFMTLTVGILSVLSAGWWGQFGDRHGRRVVIVASLCGLMFLDVMFALVSVPDSIFSHHGQTLLLLGPVVEGLLGGWAVFQAAVNAYISDCTPHGSRARVFSRVQGIFYVGFALGPEVGGLILRYTPGYTTSIFYTSIALSLVNFLFVTLVVPESVAAEDMTRRQAIAAERSTDASDVVKSSGPLAKARENVASFFAPLALFVPKKRDYGNYKDWNLTFLSVGLFGYLLTVALFQIKYLYAKKLYGWETEKLGNYISFMGFIRAMHLLVILPTIIRVCKRNSSRNLVHANRQPSEPDASASSSSESADAPPPPAADPAIGAAILAREIHFDLIVAKISLLLDLTSHTLVAAIAPANSLYFVGFTALSSMGAGLVPAVHSLALCIHQASGDGAETGKLFGALSVLTAIGSTILGPLVFGSLYQLTVASFPEAIFCLAAGIIAVSFALICLVRSRRYVAEGTLAAVRPNRAHWLLAEGSVVPVAQQKGKAVAVPVSGDNKQRGRSRRSKQLVGSYPNRRDERR